VGETVCFQRLSAGFSAGFSPLLDGLWPVSPPISAGFSAVLRPPFPAVFSRFSAGISAGFSPVSAAEPVPIAWQAFPAIFGLGLAISSSGIFLPVVFFSNSSCR
jgi:hypothetical protein